MDKLEFRKLLFKVAFCTMACDGEIDQSEIDEMKLIDKNTSYFDSVDLSGELSELIDEFKNHGTKVIESLFSTLHSVKLNPIQELLILEVSLRIIYADQKHDDNEIKFLHMLRAKLDLYDEVIHDRFGDVDILYRNDYSKNIIIQKPDNIFIQDIKLPDLVDLDHKIFD